MVQEGEREVPKVPPSYGGPTCSSSSKPNEQISEMKPSLDTSLEVTSAMCNMPLCQRNTVRLTLNEDRNSNVATHPLLSTLQAS
jgi:hypothetical protein